MKILPELSAALRLTRAGNLGAATTAIRNMLGGSGAGGGERPAPSPVFDLTPARVVPGSPGPEARRPEPAPGPASRDAGRFLKCRVETQGGALGYRLYIPAGVSAGAPLVVMLHGCTQNPEDFARGTAMNALADEFGCLVAYPGQTAKTNAQKCWNWFKPGDQVRGRGEPALIAALVGEVIARHHADAARVFVAGLSAGGAAAAIMAAAYPEVFAAVGIHSGLACGAARDLPSALQAMKAGAARPDQRPPAFVPVITFHGDADATVAEINARQIVAAASDAAGLLTTSRESGVSAGGRRYTRAVGRNTAGRTLIEQWTVHGAGHAWSGGDAAGSYTDPAGPDASRAILNFFLAQPHRGRA